MQTDSVDGDNRDVGLGEPLYMNCEIEVPSIPKSSSPEHTIAAEAIDEALNGLSSDEETDVTKPATANTKSNGVKVERTNVVGAEISNGNMAATEEKVANTVSAEVTDAQSISSRDKKVVGPEATTVTIKDSIIQVNFRR